MIRLTLALVTWISLISVASASLTPRKESAALGNQMARAWSSKPLAEVLEQTATRGTRPEYVLTNETEVWLNGKPCRYEAVPADASIVRMEVAADKKTVLKIYFRTRK